MVFKAARGARRNVYRGVKKVSGMTATVFLAWLTRGSQKCAITLSARDSPASTVASSRSFDAVFSADNSTTHHTNNVLDVHQNVPLNNTSEQDEFRQRFESYDSLNLEDLVLDTDEGTLFTFDEIPFKWPEQQPLKTQNLFRPINENEERSFSEASMEFGVDPEFVEDVKSTFAAKRSRAFAAIAVN